MRTFAHRPSLPAVLFLLLVSGAALGDQGQAAPSSQARGDPLPPGAIARLGSLRFRAGFFLHQAAFTPDGKHLITAGAGQPIIVWNADSGKAELKFPEQRESRLFALSFDGKWLAGLTKSMTGPQEDLVIFEAKTAKIVRRLDKLTLTALSFSADGKLLAAAGYRDPGSTILQWWDVHSGKRLQQINLKGAWTTSLTFAVDGKTLAGCEPYNTARCVVRLWDVASGKELAPLKGHDNLVQAVTFSPNGKLLLSGSEDQTIRVWDYAAGKELHALLATHGGVRSLRVAPDGNCLVSGYADGTITVWDLATLRPARQWRGHAGYVSCLSFSPDGRTLVSTGVFENVPRRWDVATGREIDPTPGQRGVAVSLAFSGDGQSLFTCGRERRLLRWDLPSGKAETLREFPHPGFAELAVAPDHRRAAILDYDKVTLELWTTGPQALPRILGTYRQPSDPPHNFRPLYVRFSPNSRFLAAVIRDRIHIFDADSGQELHQIKTSGKETYLEFTPDSSVLAATEWLGQPVGEAVLRFWDVATAQEILQFETERFACQLSFSPSGRWLVGSGDWREPLQFWDLTTGKSISLADAAPGGYGVAFTPDSHYVAIGGLEADPVTRILELPSGKEVARLDGKDPAVLTVAFSPDGRTLATGGASGTVLLWDWQRQSHLPQTNPAPATPVSVRALLAQWKQKPAFRYPEGKYGKGELKYINDLPVLSVRGTPDEIGAQIGTLALKPMLADMDVQRLIQDVLKSHQIKGTLPYLAKLCNGLLYRFPEAYRRELDAMARTSGLERDLLVIVNQGPDLYRMGCSTLIVEPGRSATGKPLFGRNLDTQPIGGLYKYSLVMVYHPEGKHAFASIGFPGTVGPFSAINDAGLAVATDGIYATADGSARFAPLGLPIFVTLRRLMEESASVADATRFLQKNLPDTMLSLTACDKLGGVVFELTSKHCVVRGPEDDICACTNHFRSQLLSVSKECWRYLLLDASRKLPKLALADVAKKMHQVNQGGWTLQSMIFEPAELRVHIGFGKGPVTGRPSKALELRPLFSPP
jgi:WD40 repeat protein